MPERTGVPGYQGDDGWVDDATSPRRPSREAVDEAIQVLIMADVLLPDEGAWDRSADRVEGPVDGRYTLYGALATACKQVTGQFAHRHPALQVVRAVIAIRMPGREWEHRLAEFNSEADFCDVKAVLSSAIERAKSIYGAT
jgi:hypothetical protein